MADVYHYTNIFEGNEAACQKTAHDRYGCLPPLQT
jgi:hypothetical protein